MRDNDVELLLIDVVEDDTIQEERPSQEETASADEDIPPLEYARYYGLTNDYQAEQPLDPAHPPSPTIFIFGDVDCEDVWTSELLQEFSTRECLTIDKDTAALLRDVLSAPQMTEDVGAEAGRFRISDLRQELPILRSDNEWDLRHFGKIDPADLNRFKLPQEETDDEKDEGLSWLKKHLNLPAQFDARANAEKLEVPADTLPFLQAALSDPYALADESDLIAEEIRYQRNLALEPITPPLLPLTPPHTPFVPSSPTGRLELFSDRTDPTVAELQTPEDAMKKQDAILPHHGMKEGAEDPMLIESDEIGYVYSPLRLIAEPPSSSPLKRKFADLRVEGPLTPPTTLPSPAKKAKSVSFSEMLHECIPDLPTTYAAEANEPDSPGSFEAFFNEVIEPIAEKANRKLKQEQLQEVDTTKRVDIPVMDFSLPKAPWLEYARQLHGKHRDSESELDTQKKLLARVKHEDLQLVQPWHGISKIERALPWSPFPPQLGKMALDEKIDDDGALSRLLSGVNLDGEMVESDMLIWKPEGLRILKDADDSDYELEPAVSEEAGDMQALIKKRRFEMDEAAEVLDPRTDSKDKPPAGESTTQRATDAPTPGLRSGKSTVDKTLAPAGASHKSDSGLLFGGFSASTALSNFIEIHSAVAKKPKVTHDISSRPKSGPKHEIQPTRTASAASVIIPHPNPLQRPGTPAPPLPSPATPTNLLPCHFVVFTTLLKQRYLLRHIQELYPTAILIERDFGTQSVGNAPPAEADLLCSPATAVLMTTLQKAKQRALPGQAAQATGGLRERIALVSERYERVLVLVSEDAGKPETTADKRAGATELRALSERDCEALASLTAFAAALSGDVSVLYVAGGEEELARWTSGIMARFGVPGLKLLQEETLWELFLRRAGLNAFAAQVILAELKKPASTPPPQAQSSSAEPAPSNSDADFGVAAFVKMAADERMRRFEPLLGGRRMLRRVSGALDQRWVSASDGYVM